MRKTYYSKLKLNIIFLGIIYEKKIEIKKDLT